MKRRTSVAFADSHRQTLALIVSRLAVPQKKVADECNISQGWLSQLMSGKRSGAEIGMITRIRDGLLRLIDTYGGEEKKELASMVQEQFSAPAVDKQATQESAEALRITADVVEILFNRCQTKSMRRQVIAFLTTAIEQ